MSKLLVWTEYCMYVLYVLYMKWFTNLNRTNLSQHMVWMTFSEKQKTYWYNMLTPSSCSRGTKISVTLWWGCFFLIIKHSHYMRPAQCKAGTPYSALWPLYWCLPHGNVWQIHIVLHPIIQKSHSSQEVRSWKIPQIHFFEVCCVIMTNHSTFSF